MDISIDGGDALVRAFTEAAATTTPSLLPVLKSEAELLGRTWRSNARRTAGRHGRLYPASITTELFLHAGAIEAETGPDAGKPQGRMGRGFEYGSSHQPPHLDGARAYAVRAPKFVHAVEAEIGTILGRLL